MATHHDGLCRSHAPALLGLVLGGCAFLGLTACSESSEAASALPSEAEAELVRAHAFQPLSAEALDARIQQASAAARGTDRKVLLVFVADWCEDCHEVVRLSGLEPARTVLRERYEVVYVDVGRFDRHRALIDEHAIDRIAALVVLDPASGARIARTTLEPITGSDRGLDADGLAAWLRAPIDRAAR